MGIEGEIIEPFAVAEIYCDGFEHEVSNGMMMITGYRIMRPCGYSEPQRVVVVRLVIKVENILDAMADAKRALSTPVGTCEGERLGRH